MISPVSLDEVKTDLRLEPDETGEDSYIEGLLASAASVCFMRLNRPETGPDALTDSQIEAFAQAIRLLVGYWYRNRQASGTLPAAIGFVLEPLRLPAGA